MIEDTIPVMDDEEVSARDELYDLAEALHDADKMEKTGKSVKEQLRDPFFTLISEVVREEVPLARQTVEVEINEGFDIDKWRALNYPEWRIVALDQNTPDEMLITLEENEAFKKFEFTHNGFRYGRQIRFKGGGFDAEGFVKMTNDIEDDALAEMLLDCIGEETVVVYSLDEAKAIKLMAEMPEMTAYFQDYTLPGKPEVAFLPIKAAKEEEE